MLRDLPRPRLLPALWVALAFVILSGCAVLLDGCALLGPTVETAEEVRQYKSDLKACRPAEATCEQYVACRRRVESEHGRDYRGRCEP